MSDSWVSEDLLLLLEARKLITQQPSSFPGRLLILILILRGDFHSCLHLFEGDFCCSYHVSCFLVCATEAAGTDWKVLPRRNKNLPLSQQSTPPQVSVWVGGLRVLCCTADPSGLSSNLSPGDPNRDQAGCWCELCFSAGFPEHQADSFINSGHVEVVLGRL